MIYTEADIKAALDGWLFEIDYARGKTHATEVPVDFIPSHKPKFVSEDDDDKPHHNAHPWSEREDQTVLAMRQAGNTFREIAKALNLSPSSVQNRFALLRTRQGLGRTGPIRKSKYPPELTARIVKLREDGFRLREIGLMVGLDKDTVYSIHREHRRRIERQERAA